jgi:hypothetical protein
MNKRVMLLGAVTCVSGIVTVAGAGCSSDPEVTGGGDSGTDAVADVRTERTPPPPPDEEVVDAGQCPRVVDLTVQSLDESRGWKKAVRMPGSCSATDLSTLETNMKDTSVKTYFDLGKNLSDSCVACAIGKDTDEHWPSIIGLDSTDGQTGFYNYGACFGDIEGEACGKALQYEQFCYNVACSQCAKTSTERQTCVNAAGSDGMCKDFVATTKTACPNRTTTNKTCGTVLNGVKYLCGGSADGGTDAGDGGDGGDGGT